MNHNLVQDAKYKIYNSELIKYVSSDKIENAFLKVHTFDNLYDFLGVYGKSDYDNERLEGFNRNGESYLGPYATPHTAIHEVLHTLSSKFDSEGHRVVNGIAGDRKLRFADQVNEGITDYLACKISGESPRNYRQGNRLFAKLEPMMVKYTNNPDILMQTYINNDVGFIQNFLNYFGKENTFEEIYDQFLFKRDDEIDELLKPVEKNLNKYIKKTERQEKWNGFVNRIKNIFSKNKVKALPSGNYQMEKKKEHMYKKKDINNLKIKQIKYIDKTEIILINISNFQIIIILIISKLMKQKKTEKYMCNIIIRTKRTHKI